MRSSSITEAQEFLSTVISSQTACISACENDFGGCHTFGGSLSSELKMDSIGMRNSSKNILEIFKQPMGSGSLQPYENICITGCLYELNPVMTAMKKYDLTKLKNIYVVIPPHQVNDEKYYAECSSLKKTLPEKHNYKITFLTAGINSAPSYCIGIPNTIPKKSLELKNIISKNCYGLIYIYHLLTKQNHNVDKIALKIAWLLDEELEKEHIKYLKLYFSQIAKIAKQKLEESPSVLVVTKDEYEKKEIEEIAKLYKINIIFTEKLAQEKFVAALREIGEKGGLVATNGAQTLMQAIMLKSPILVYANLSCNFNFLNQLARLMPEELIGTAKVILGRSTDSFYLENEKNVTEVYRIIYSALQKSLSKFEENKTSEEICLVLKKLTGIKWTFDITKQSALAKGENDRSVLDYLISHGLNIKQRQHSKTAAMWAESLSLVLDLTKATDIEKLFTLSPMVPSLKIEHQRSTKLA